MIPGYASGSTFFPGLRLISISAFSASNIACPGQNLIFKKINFSKISAADCYDETIRFIAFPYILPLAPVALAAASSEIAAI